VWQQLKRRHDAGAMPRYQQLPSDGIGKCRDCGKETPQLKGVTGYLCRECKRERERKYNSSRPPGGIVAGQRDDMTGQKARSGGTRPGAGALQVRLHLDRKTALMLRILTFARRGITGRADLAPDDVATDLIRAAYDEYEAGIAPDET
jgi:hypothetical protein